MRTIISINNTFFLSRNCALRLILSENSKKLISVELLSKENPESTELDKINVIDPLQIFELQSFLKSVLDPREVCISCGQLKKSSSI